MDTHTHINIVTDYSVMTIQFIEIINLILLIFISLIFQLFWVISQLKKYTLINCLTLNIYVTTYSRPSVNAY